MDLSTYKQAFQSEAEEYLAQLNAQLLELEKNPSRSEPVQEIFRAIHTLKGMSATMGYEQLAQYAHEVEGILDQVRKGERALERGLLDRLFVAFDRVSALTSAASEERTLVELASWIEELRAQAPGVPASARPSADPPVTAASAPEASAPRAATAASHAPAPIELSPDETLVAAEAQRQGSKIHQMDVELVRGCALKSVRVFMVFRALEGVAEVLVAHPDAKQLEAGNFETRFSLVVAGTAPPEELRRRVDGISEVVGVEVRPLHVDAAHAGSATSGRAAAPARPAAAMTAKAVQSVRVPIERLDNLMNLVGELVISKIRLFQIGRQHALSELKDALAHFERVTNELQDEVVSARLIPVDAIFARFPRMVRDLSRELGKEIEFVTEGGEIELDRTVIDEIGDPLVHLIRNAIDHGLEPPDARARAGKPRTGLLKLSARREKNQVVLTVEDDGRGIDVARVRTLALERGMLTAEQNAKLADDEAILLVATPGFSTAGEVSKISGRGVGVDAVKSKVESFHGSFAIESAAGSGSRFMLRLPLTLAIIQALLVRVRRELYAIPIATVLETFEMDESAVRHMQQQEVVLLREEVLPIVRLERLLEVPDGAAPAPMRHVVVVEVRNHRIGIVVDDLAGQQEIAIKPLDRIFRATRGFGGVTILGDGTIVLILELLGLVDRAV